MPGLVRTYNEIVGLLEKLKKTLGVVPEGFEKEFDVLQEGLNRLEKLIKRIL